MRWDRFSSSSPAASLLHTFLSLSHTGRGETSNLPAPLSFLSSRCRTFRVSRHPSSHLSKALSITPLAVGKEMEENRHRDSGETGKHKPAAAVHSTGNTGTWNSFLAYGSTGTPPLTFLSLTLSLTAAGGL